MGTRPLGVATRPGDVPAVDAVWFVAEALTIPFDVPPSSRWTFRAFAYVSISGRAPSLVRYSEGFDHPDQIGVGKTEPSRGFSLGGHPQAFVESSGVAVLCGDV